MLRLLVPAILFALACVSAVPGCCQREKKAPVKPTPAAPVEEPAEKPAQPETTEAAADDPLDLDDLMDLDVDVQVGEEDEGDQGPDLGGDVTVE